MTDLLFHRDAYMSVFDAEVVAVTADGAVALDRTCFYPGGGGQPHDTGVLSSPGWRVRVRRVSHGPDGVLHWINGEPPAPGTHVRGTLDWERRYALMRTHTALHILCGVIWRYHRALSTGCDMKPLTAHIDFELEAVDAELLTHLQTAAEEEIAAARPVNIGVRDRDEVEGIGDLLRTKKNLLPKDVTQIRTVEIVGLDLQADGGTHVANTSEVLGIQITRYKSKGRRNKRIYVELPPSEGA